jgi:phage FluMu protein Com
MPPPTAERLKVRCYRCNQLLAVAPTKAGTVVACPKCKAELLIPRPDSQPPAEEPTDPSVSPLNSGTFPALAPVTKATTTGREGAASPSFLDEISALIPPEVAALRPEDLRVEAEVFGAITREPSPPPPAAEPFSFPGVLSAADFSAPPAAVERPPAAPQEIPGFFASTGSAPAASGTVESPPPLPISVPAPEANIVVPPIRLEPEAIRPRVDTEPRGIREVVLPASVVLAWSLFVLSAIPLAFLAGLMIGHFLWRTGP